MATTIELLIPAISALLGALIGGGFTIWGTWYSLKKQREKDIWIEKLERLGMADKKLFGPFLECVYQLDAKRDIRDIDNILGALRGGREYFIYCPTDLKQKFLTLYSTLVRTHNDQKGCWNAKDLDNFSEQSKQIEKLIHKMFTKMEF